MSVADGSSIPRSRRARMSAVRRGSAASLATSSPRDMLHDPSADAHSSRHIAELLREGFVRPAARGVAGTYAFHFAGSRSRSLREQPLDHATDRTARTPHERVQQDQMGHVGGVRPEARRVDFRPISRSSAHARWRVRAAHRLSRAWLIDSATVAASSMTNASPISTSTYFSTGTSMSISCRARQRAADSCPGRTLGHCRQYMPMGGAARSTGSRRRTRAPVDGGRLHERAELAGVHGDAVAVNRGPSRGQYRLGHSTERSCGSPPSLRSCLALVGHRQWRIRCLLRAQDERRRPEGHRLLAGMFTSDREVVVAALADADEQVRVD